MGAPESGGGGGAEKNPSNFIRKFRKNCNVLLNYLEVLQCC